MINRQQKSGISIVTPSFNRQDLIPRLIHSVLKVEYRPIQILVVDDGSADATVSVARNLEDECITAGVELVVYEEKHKGAQYARNLGAQYAAFENILFLDSDDYVDAKGLDVFLSAIEGKKFDIAVGLVEKIDSYGNKIDTIGREWKSHETNKILNYDWHTNSVLYKKKFLIHIGGWDPVLGGSQDWVIQVHSKIASHHIMHVPVRIAYWVDHKGDRIGANAFKEKYTLSVLVACGLNLKILRNYKGASLKNQSRLVGKGIIHIYELFKNCVPRKEVVKIIKEFWPVCVAQKLILCSTYILAWFGTGK